MTTLVLWLAEFLGLKGFFKSFVIGVIKWTTRLALLAVFLILLWLLGNKIYEDPEWQVYAAGLAGAWLLWKLFQWWRDRGNAEVGERTIDGKVVPNMLAAAALNIPPQSPDADYALRGLPDFGKVLLKLDATEFEYVPQIAGPAGSVAEERLEEPGTREIPEWPFMVVGVICCLVFGLLLVMFLGLDEVFFSSPASPAEWRNSAISLFLAVLVLAVLFGVMLGHFALQRLRSRNEIEAQILAFMIGGMLFCLPFFALLVYVLDYFNLIGWETSGRFLGLVAAPGGQLGRYALWRHLRSRNYEEATGPFNWWSYEW